MKYIQSLVKTALVGALVTAGSFPAFAGGGTFTGSGEWIVNPTATATFSSTATSGSGGSASIVVVDLTHGGNLVYRVDSSNGSPPTATGGATVSAGSYHIVQGVTSPGSASTTVSW